MLLRAKALDCRRLAAAMTDPAAIVAVEELADDLEEQADRVATMAERNCTSE